VEECVALLEAIAPGFTPAELGSLEEVVVATAWTDEADPRVVQRLREAAGHFPCSRSLEWPRPEIGALFMREVADVHRELYAENGELYGEELAVKIERCLAVSDGEANRAEQARVEYRESCLELLDGFDLLLTPTLQCVAPPTGIGDLALRERLIANTLPFNALGWPALALPCGAAEDALPPSVQLKAKPGADALVLAAGRRLASLI
jgi:Asp-tRNA(Asn)/Glu-tRNA(Gln) amidotransferase A subunit family amidase